ncbi:hypothetical protein [Janthinobacterium sp. PC23-8]|uniref:hypothetical protein n=1 Tax=Janthinobacterium sp. PC23-8 TaxID=2012679 RepID=UPI0020CEEF3A|nr:hypothetical protein [Janthinobacterium sp. PC23-8]
MTAVTQVLQRYGLQVKGHFWADAPDQMAWRTALDTLLADRADVWLILADEAELAKPGVRYGLSLLCTSLRELRGAGFPVALLWRDKAADLPSLLTHCLQLDEAAAAWPAKIVAKANMAGKALAPDYRFSVLGDEQLGQWFELGPRAGNWDGIVCGISGGGAEITFQAVGASGKLPERSVLEFAQQGLQLKVGAMEYRAWAVRNQIDAAHSCYVRVKGCPQSLLFMPYAEESQAEANVIALC